MRSFELGGDKKTKGAALTFVCPFSLGAVSLHGMLTGVLAVNAKTVLHLGSCYAVCVLPYYYEYAWTMP